MKNKLFAIALALIIGCQLVSAESEKYQVRPGDTLYSIARHYGVTVEAILAANPKIEETKLPAGYMLVIPDAKKSEPKAAEKKEVEKTAPKKESETPAPKKETEKNNPPSDPKGSKKEIVVPTYNHVPLEEGDHWTDGVLNLAVIMPFNLNASNEEQTKVQMRAVEFYQGVLLAADEMQKTGRRVTLQAYDLGTESMSNILGNPHLSRADVIFAPMEESEVRSIAAWGNSHGTPVVSPFVFNESMLNEYEHLLQVNSHKNMLYPQLTDELLKRFSKYTFVFLTDTQGKQKADPYPAELMKALRAKNIPFKELSYKDPERLMACDSILGLKNADIMFVPVTSQQNALRRMLNGLQHVKIQRDARHQAALAESGQSVRQPQLAMLGFPEWLMYTQDFIDYFHTLNVYMFSKIYVNPLEENVKKFYSDFKYWYARELMALTPKYGILGYDLANYFLKSLTRHGRHLEERIDGELGESLQTVLSFKRDGEGKGMYNHGLYLVHFTPESTIEKIVVK